jgi:hypothetical protein
LFVPWRVTNLIWTAPDPVESAPAVAVDTVTSSIASSLGLMSENNPSVDLLLLSCVFTPSSVMLTAARGRPLTVELRFVDAVSTPGSIVTALIASRLTSGRFEIWFASIVVAITDDCVWTIAAPAVTVTTSSTPPTSSVALTVDCVETFSTTFGMTLFLNPSKVVVTAYVPGGSDGSRKNPFSSLTVWNSTPVALFFARISAPGMTPPEESTTVPDKVAVLAPCAYAGVAMHATATNSQDAVRNRMVISPPARTVTVCHRAVNGNPFEFEQSG